MTLFYRYKRALHAKKRELEKQREEKTIEHKPESYNADNQIRYGDEGLDDVENIGDIEATKSDENKNDGKRKLSWDFGNVENLPGCSSALDNLENIQHQVGKKKE